MRFLRKILPHLGIALGLAMLVVLYVNDRNPMMGFLSAPVSTVYLIALCLMCIVLGIVMLLERARK